MTKRASDEVALGKKKAKTSKGKGKEDSAKAKPTAKTLVKKRKAGSDSSDSPAKESKKRRQGSDKSKSIKGRNYKLEPPLTVSFTGARAGDILVGYKDSEDTKNVVLKVLTGVVKAPIKVLQYDGVDEEKVIQVLAKQHGLAYERAEMMYKDRPKDDGSFPNHQSIGKACHCGGISSQSHNCDCPVDATFVILQQGVWQSFADDAGKGSVLNSYVENATPVTWRDILNSVGRKTLILRSRLFCVDPSPTIIRPDAPELKGRVIVNCQMLETDDPMSTSDSSIYKVNTGTYAKVPKGASSRLARACIPELVVQACPKATLEDAQACVTALQGLTGGALKSALQKAIRFGSNLIGLFDGQKVPTSVYAAVCCGLLFADAGSFSPELQLFTRGCTAALKRTAVILLEDAWPVSEVSPTQLAALISLARITQLVGTYEPSEGVIRGTMSICAAAATSTAAINWKGQNIDGCRVVKIPVKPEHAVWFQAASEIIKEVRSFPGDLAMFDKVASMARKGRLKTLQGGSWARPDTCPMHHLVDQHVYRGFGHLVGPELGASFKSRFQNAFNLVTGINFRTNNVDGFEERKVVKAMRFAQEQILRLALPVSLRKTQSLDVLDGQDLRVSLALDAGVLASAVGPITVKYKRKDYIVTLGTTDVDAEVVMLKASRNAKNLYEGISAEDRRAVVDVVRHRKLLIKKRHSPLIQGTAEFLPTEASPLGTWHLNGEPWGGIVERGLDAAVPIHAPPSWAQKPIDATVLTNNSAIIDAYQVQGSGVTEGGEEIVRKIVSKCHRNVLLRALALMRQQYDTIAMPVPGLDGGRGSDQMMAYTGDWDVYRLLVLFSRLVPGALRPQQAPRFTIPNAPLLRLLEMWVSSELRSKAATASETQINPWSGHKYWRNLVDCDAMMREHQRSAVNDMIQRDTRGVPGHFLVMDVGYGKTLTTLSYLWHWLNSEAGASSVEYFIWTTPTSIVKDTSDQIRDKWHAPVHTVSRPKPRMPVQLRKFHVNVMSMDLARDVLERGLADVATKTVFVFDEVDKVYGNSLRTSAAQRLAMTCAKFVCQTATPMTSTKDERLSWWLSSTELYPVSKNNFLVAANGMVSKQIELGIETQEEVIKTPMHDAVRKAYQSHHGDWMRMAKATQSYTDSALVERAVKHAKGEADGVLLVANDQEHILRLLEMLRAQGVKAGSLEDIDDVTTRCIVVTKRQSRGYNGAIRLGAMVTGTYASNGADRYQLRGRLRRIGQRRSKVLYETVLMENSLLDLLHTRQQRVDTMNISLKELGEKFGREVLEGMG